MRVITIFLFTTFFILQNCKEDKTSQGSPTHTDAIDKDTTEPLASWNDGPSKSAIMDFIKKTTTQGSDDFVPVSDRIACFDNDGTLWSEQPIYFQLAFALDQVKTLSAEHPEWKTTQPFKAVIEGDVKTVMAGGEKSMGTILAATHAGMTTEEFTASVKNG